MNKRVTVMDIDRHTVMRPANCVQCDQCEGIAIIPAGGIDEMRKEGWIIPKNRISGVSFHPRKPGDPKEDFCPDCRSVKDSIPS